MMTTENKGIEKALQQFAELMINRIKDLKTDWHKPWLNYIGAGAPQNISGRKYTNFNSFVLYLYTEAKKWKTPTYMTFKQAVEMGAKVTKGEKSFPILLWKLLVYDKNGKKVSLDFYNRLSVVEQLDYKVVPYLRQYYVFNVEQTNLPEKFPQMWEKLQEKFRPLGLADRDRMYANAELDRLVEKHEWVCPIYADKLSAKAYYSPTNDHIVLPMKSQFLKPGTDAYEQGMEFYGTMLHEMTHSTGVEARLNRDMSGHFGTASYGREELIAELTAAVIGQQLGFSKNMEEQNAAYLDNWIKGIEEEPKFLMSILTDVNKAANFIGEAIEKQSEALAADGQANITDDHARTDFGKFTNAYTATVEKINNGELTIKPETIEREIGNIEQRIEAIKAEQPSSQDAANEQAEKLQDETDRLNAYKALSVFMAGRTADSGTGKEAEEHAHEIPNLAQTATEAVKGYSLPNAPTTNKTLKAKDNEMEM